MAPHKKNWPLWAGCGRVFSQCIARYVPPKTLFGPLLARLWRRYCLPWHRSMVFDCSVAIDSDAEKVQRNQKQFSPKIWGFQICRPCSAEQTEHTYKFGGSVVNAFYHLLHDAEYGRHARIDTDTYSVQPTRTTSRWWIQAKASQRKRWKYVDEDTQELESCIVLNEHNTVFARSGPSYVIGLSMGPPESWTQTVSRSAGFTRW